MRSLTPAQKRLILIAALSAAVLAAVLGVLLFLTHRRTDRAAYYASLADGRALVYQNGTPSSADWQLADGAAYLSLSDAQALFSDRWYEDPETGTVRLALYDSLVILTESVRGYERAGAFHALPDAPLLHIGGQTYLSLDFLARTEGFSFSVCEDPEALILWSDGTAVTDASLTSAARLRTGASVFSPAADVLPAGTAVRLTADAPSSGLVAVLTEGGAYGYVSARSLSGQASGFVSAPASVTAAGTHLFSPALPNVLFHYVDNAERAEKRLEEGLGAVTNIGVLCPTCLTIADTAGNLADASSERYVTLAHEAGMDVWLMAENINRQVSAAELFASSSARDALSENILAAARRTGADGINLDVERLKADTSFHYVQFVREFAARCHAEGLVLSVCVPPPYPFNRHLNFPELAAYADYLVVMIYNEAWKDPGPSASLPYVKTSLDYCAELFPAEQTIAGLCTEARKWRVTDAGTEKPILSMKDGQALLEQTPDAEWLSDLGCYYAEVPDEGGPWQVWFEDERAMRERLALMRTYRPAGYSVWVWGLESDGFFELLGE